MVLALLGLALPLQVCPMSAWAADPALAEAEALATRATAYFKSGLHRQAADLYMRAFALSRRPLMVYNAARSLEEASDLAESRALFEHYRGLKGVSASERAEADLRIAGLTDRLRTAGPHPSAPPARGTRDDPSSQQQGTPPTMVSGVRDEREAGATDPGFPVWQSVGAGVSLAAAGGCWLVARQQVQEALAIDVRDQEDKAAYLERADKAQAWRGVGVGFAVLGGGLGVWALVRAVRRPATNTVLVPLPGGVALVGHF